MTKPADTQATAIDALVLDSAADPEALVRLTIDSYEDAAQDFRDHYYPQNRASPNLTVRHGLMMFAKELLRARCRTVLDVGCGPGEHVNFIARATGAAVVGVDRSNNMLRMAQSRFQGVRLARMDVRRLGFSDSSFDGILSSNVVHHLPRGHVGAFFDELWRIARPGATMYIVTKEGTFEGIVAHEQEAKLRIGPQYVLALTGEELAQYVTAAGFTVTRTTTPGDGYVHLLATKPAETHPEAALESAR